MQLNRDDLLKAYTGMCLIRNFEDRVHDEFAAGTLPGFVHLYAGEEASAIGVCMNLNDQDTIASTHRGHGHCIAKGCDVNAMMKELFGKKEGMCGGKGGSMHIADLTKGMLGANGIVGGGLPIATGAALAAQMDGGDDVAVAFFGDGASNEGTFHSSINLASIWKLPVIYVCENNGWAIAVPASYALSVEDVSVRAVSYGIPGITVDGTDVLAVRETMEQAVERARTGGGPTLLECKTYRKYVDDESTDGESVSSPSQSLNDPVITLRDKVLEQGLASASDLSDIDREVISSIEDAVNFAKAGDVPLPEDALTQVFAS